MAKELYQLNGFQRFLWTVGGFFAGIGLGIARFFKKLPFRIFAGIKAVGRAFRRFGMNFVRGNVFVKLSYFIMGTGNICARQIIKGLIYLFIQAGFILYMVFFGAGAVANFITLGTKQQGLLVDADGNPILTEWGAEIIIKGDNSLMCLLYGVVTLLIIIAFVAIYITSVKSAVKSQEAIAKGKRPASFMEDVKDLFDAKLYRTMLFIPVLCVLVLTVVPLIFMILMAFTNYNRAHLPPGNLFDWVGFGNFARVFASDSVGGTFFPVLGWTLVWALLATFTTYIGGIVVALMINKKGIVGKGVFRTVFVLTIAIPQVITLMVVNNFFNEYGPFNTWLLQLGISSERIPFLSDPRWNGLIPRIMVILVNLWIGIPYTMLITTGILMNIPAELYESARIDGASPVKLFLKITMPYVLFVTAPYLIQQFIGNINNFNIIFLLTGGEPTTSGYYKAGKTDLLITWLYRLTIEQNDYDIGATIGIMTFVTCALFSLLAYTQSASYKKEDDFQ